MTVSTYEFIRRFLIHIVPSGFHRIRHYGLFASHIRCGNLARIRQCLDVQSTKSDDESLESTEDRPCPFVCHTCGSPMRIIETLKRVLLVRVLTVTFAFLSLIGWAFLWSAPGRY